MSLIDLFKSKKILGLDIGSYSVKLVELKPKKRGRNVGYELCALSYEIVPYQAIVEGSIMDSAAVSDTIQRAFYESKTKNNGLAFGVSGSSVIIKRIEVQRTNPEEQHEQIRFAAEPHIPYDISEVDMDYEIIDDGSSNETLSVVIAAVKREKVSEYVNVVNLSGKVPEIADLDSFAIVNSVMYNYEKYRERTIAMVNIGASITSIVICSRGKPVFARDLAFGGNQFTDLIQKELNLKYEKAENAKKGLNVEDVSPTLVNKVLNMVFMELKKDISTTFDFYRNNYDGENVEAMLLCGGTAGMKSLVEYFKTEFDIAVEVVDPFLNIEVNEKKFNAEFIRDMGPVFTVAMGLALRAVGEK